MNHLHISEKEIRKGISYVCEDEGDSEIHKKGSFSSFVDVHFACFPFFIESSTTEKVKQVSGLRLWSLARVYG
jgi:hypothetical protein